MRLLRHILLGAALVAGGSERRETTNSIGMKLVQIEPGEFRMGQDGPPYDFGLIRFPERVDAPDWDEKPVHTVRITRPFFIGATEVTNSQYEQFDPSHRAYRGRLGLSSDDQDAAVFVDWDDAVAFCRWLSKKEGRPYRLPTEAEWEYACRAGTTTAYSTGDRLPPGHQKWILDAVPGDTRIRGRDYQFQKLKGGGLPPEYGPRRTLAVAKTAPNPWGLFDMHGNVREWVNDWYAPYPSIPQADPVGPKHGDFRVARGGSHSQHAILLRSANRAGYLPTTRTPDTGFRIVLGEAPRTKPLPPPQPPAYARNVSQRTPKHVRKSPDLPFFNGPRVYMKVPTGSAGPAFSNHNHSPAITECPNGDLLAIWYSCVEEPGHELNNMATRLRLGASEWEEASLFWDQPDANDHAPKLWWDGRKTLFHSSNGINENILRTSTDNGATWSRARTYEPQGELGNQPAITREGWIVFAHDDPLVGIVYSTDAGATWQHTRSALANPQAEWYPHRGAPRMPGIHNTIVQLNDGRLLAFGRIDEAEIQARFERKTPMSISSDMGKTWDLTASEFPAISSTQRAVMIRLREGPLLWCSFTDQARDVMRNRTNRKGMLFQHSGGGQYTGFGLYAALSFDDGKSWPVRRLVTPGGPSRQNMSTDKLAFTTNDTEAEWLGYLAAVQARDGRIHLISSKNHYEFNLAWLQQLPDPPRQSPGLPKSSTGRF